MMFKDLILFHICSNTVRAIGSTHEFVHAFINGQTSGPMNHYISSGCKCGRQTHRLCWWWWLCLFGPTANDEATHRTDPRTHLQSEKTADPNLALPTQWHTPPSLAHTNLFPKGKKVLGPCDCCGEGSGGAVPTAVTRGVCKLAAWFATTALNTYVYMYRCMCVGVCVYRCVYV